MGKRLDYDNINNSGPIYYRSSRYTHSKLFIHRGRLYSMWTFTVHVKYEIMACVGNTTGPHGWRLSHNKLPQNFILGSAISINYLPTTHEEMDLLEAFFELKGDYANYYFRKRLVRP